MGNHIHLLFYFKTFYNDHLNFAYFLLHLRVIHFSKLITFGHIAYSSYAKQSELKLIFQKGKYNDTLDKDWKGQC